MRLKGLVMSHALFTPEAKYLLQENDTAGMKDFCENRNAKVGPIASLPVLSPPSPPRKAQLN